MTSLFRRAGVENITSLSLALILGLVVQVQITPEIGDTKVRLNLADPFVAVLMPVIIYMAVLNWRKVVGILGWLLLVLFALAMIVFSYSYATGFAKIGFFAWSAVKYTGLYALIAYFSVGVFLSVVFNSAGYKAFVIGFVAGNVAVVMLQLLLLTIGVKDEIWSGVRFTGFAGNPNAYGFILVCAFVLCASLGRNNSNTYWQNITINISSATIICGIYYSGSIAAFLGTVLVLGILLASALTWKNFAFTMVLALMLTALPHIFEKVKLSNHWTIENKIALSWIGARGQANKEANKNANWNYNSTIGVRLGAIWQGFELWRQSPVSGAGLGVHLFEQKYKDENKGRHVDSIHNTGIWLLAETGLVGLLTFASLFIVILSRIWLNLQTYHAEQVDFYPNFAIAALICLLAWLFMSLFHELMYQRIIWLIAGMAVAEGAGKTPTGKLAVGTIDNS